MIDISLVTNLLVDRTSDAYVFFSRHGFEFARLNKTAYKLYPPYEQALKQRGFTGAAGSSVIINGVYNDRPIYLIFLGLGDLPTQEPIESYRRALGKLVRIAESHKLQSFTFDLPDPAVIGISHEQLACETATILLKASYHFDAFITDEEKKFRWTMNAQIGVNKKHDDEARTGLNAGRAIADAINLSRYWCDMPPSQLPPKVLAEQAVEKAQAHGLATKVLSKKEIDELKMGGIEGVARGSCHEPCMVILEYTAPEKTDETIALVGKGVTFDTGGLCIKPSASMLTMKDDMAGAATVLATMNVIAQLKPKVNVVAVAPLVENMPSGTAQKPGDVLTAYNGKTIEVIDTDAEGRLILADALAYAAEQYKPVAMIDVATLTGACAYALGVFYAGLFTQDNALAKRLQESSERTGDQVWRLPLDDDYKPALKSHIADLRNVGTRTYMGGAITAGLFLKEFTQGVPWVHLDTAGVAFGVPDLTYLRPGATGFGIRLLTDFVMSWKPLREEG